MASFDQFANQGGAAAWDPTKTAEAQRIAEEQLRNADYAGDFPEPLGHMSAPHVLDDEYLDDDDTSDFSDDELGDAEYEDDGHDGDDGDADDDDDEDRDDDPAEYLDGPDFSDDDRSSHRRF